MLDLKDFFHLPQVDALFEQLAAGKSGLVIVAGLDSLTAQASAAGFLPSGRATIFRILLRQFLAAQPALPTAGRRGRAPAQALIVAETKESIRIPRQLYRQVEWVMVGPPRSYAGWIEHATQRRPPLLVIDRLDAETAPAALRAAQEGVLALAQLDTVFNGVGVARHLLDLGVPRGLLDSLRWIVTVQRLAALCPKCKQPDPPTPAQLAELRCRYPNAPDEASYFRAVGCASCNYTGREGDVAVFDILRAGDDPTRLLSTPSQLSLSEYLLQLAALGYVPLDDVFGLEADQLRRTYHLFTSSERALAESNVELKHKLAQLEAASVVMQQRTEALISLQDISHSLVTSAGLADLAARVCRRTQNLCGADRAILYFLRPDGTAQVLAVNGWSTELVNQHLDAAEVMTAGVAMIADGAVASDKPTPFRDLPPGVPLAHLNLGGIPPRAGMRVPLLAQQEVVGLMMVHSTQKASFTPGDVALLQVFADQAAVAIQRAGLIDALQEKIVQLEAAQVELVKKERLEHELELARQVQQRLLPRIFPMVPGYAFAARCDPARQVGGDFYDVLLLDADCFGVVIADISDKGMPAALFMALTRSLLLAEARRERSPRVVLTNVHRLLLELGESSMFATVFYGVIDATTRRLTYVRAGHDRPLLLRGGAALPLGGEGTLLGLLDMENLRLSEEHISLAPGDKLVLYTDGLIDVLASDGKSYGLGRLTAWLQAHAHLSADELCAETFAHLAAYRGSADQYDDMTTLVVEVV